MSTLSAPGPFDALQKAAPDEPIFTLRAHDVLADPLIHEWVKLKRSAIHAAFDAGQISEAKRDLELMQCTEAENIAWQMVEWRSGISAKSETPADRPATYSGNQSTELELAAKARFDTQLHVARRIDNSVAELTDAAEALAPHGFDEERMTIAANVENLKVASASVRPKRRSYAHLEGEE